MTTPALDTGWMTRAACRGHDADEWHPETGQTGEQARAICATCPVQRECLDHALAREAYALGTSHRGGIWGGLSPRERDAEHRRRHGLPPPDPEEGPPLVDQIRRLAAAGLSDRQIATKVGREGTETDRRWIATLRRRHSIPRGCGEPVAVAASLTVRWQALLDAAGATSAAGLARQVGVASRTARRWRDHGVTPQRAAWLAEQLGVPQEQIVVCKKEGA